MIQSLRFALNIRVLIFFLNGIQNVTSKELLFLVRLLDTLSDIFNRFNTLEVFEEYSKRYCPVILPCSSVLIDNCKHRVWICCSNELINSFVVAVIWTYANKIVIASKRLLEEVNELCQVISVNIKDITKEMNL